VIRWRHFRATWEVWVLLVGFFLAFAGSMVRWWSVSGTEAPRAARLVERADAPASAELAKDVEVFFSPGGDARGAIQQAVGAAQDSILIAMYTFTDFQLSQALLDARGRGVKVLVYLDRSQATMRHSQARALAAAGIALRISSNPRIMHNKFAILDDAVVITGSYNWTKAAGDDNDENLLIVRNAEIAARYREQFVILWNMWDRKLTDEVYGR
jgi:phosphatidylserine/phosphatidylglycerophosphate/cardiolipin synthase-like enzyme